MKYFEEIKKVLLDKGAKGSININTEFKSLGLDSLDLMDMIVILEEKLNITVSDDDLVSIKKIKDILDIIDKLTKQENGK